MTALPAKPTPDTRTALIDALTARFISHPMLAVEVVTGACIYPAPDGEDADDLATRAANMAYDLECIREQGYPVSQMKIDMLRAAEAAFVAIREDEAQTRREWDGWDARIAPRPARYF